MRWLLTLVLVALPAIAIAKPTVAVAPFDDDDESRVAKAVAKIVEDDAKSVKGPKDTGKVMEKLGMSGKLDKTEKKKLRSKLDVDVLIEGKVEEEDREKVLELRVSGKGIKSSRFKIRFKSSASSTFKGDVREGLGKRLEPGNEDEEEEEAKPPPRRVAEEEEEEEEETKVRKKKKKKRRDDDEDDEPAGRHAVTQVAIRANVGAGFARRGLSYERSGNAGPPPVGTAGPSARVEVEAYPLAMESLKGLAGIGVYGYFDRTFLVGIDVPGTNKRAAITQQHFAAGVRYRIPFGQHAASLGVGYKARKYAADTMLDMPDVNYKGIEPNVFVRIGATRTVGVFLGGGFVFMLGAGEITKDYGFAKIIAFDAAGGVDIAFAPRYGLRAAIELSQVGLSFNTPKRGVSAATDRTIGLIATFEVLY